MQNTDSDYLINKDIQIDPKEFSSNKISRKKLLLIIGIILCNLAILITIILLLVLKPNNDDKKNIADEIYGNISCIYDISHGEINILSNTFFKENNETLDIYINEKKINFTNKYNFSSSDSNKVRFAIKVKELNMTNMFNGLDYLKSITFNFNSKKCKIISMESTFYSSRISNISFEKGWDFFKLTSMKKFFTIVMIY